MGRHRNTSRFRGVSRGPVAVLVALVALVLCAIGWMQLRDRTARDGTAAAQRCVEGEAVLAVTADPDIAAAVRSAAERYTATQPVVRDHCMRVEVTDRPSAAIAAAIGSVDWATATLGPRPALWIPDSMRSVRRATVPGLIDGDPKPLAGTPVVLGVSGPLRQALAAAKVGWPDLGGLQQGSLDRIGLTGWGGLKLAVPQGDPVLAGAEMVAAAAIAPQPLTEDTLRGGPAVTAVSALAVGAPPAASAADAAKAVLADPDPAKSPVHAVLTTEQQLHGSGVEAYRPGDAGPVADHPTTLLSGPWVDETQNRTAALFADFLRQPDQARLLTDAGFHVPPDPASPAAPRPVYDRLADVLAHPSLGTNATVLVDVSAEMGTQDGTRSRLANVAAALRSQLDTLPAQAAIGVWQVAGRFANGKPYLQVAATQPLTASARDAVASALTGLRPSSDRTADTYPSVLEAYTFATSAYTPGRTNSVLLITGSPTDPSADPQRLLDTVTRADPNRPIRVNIVVIGGGPVDPNLQQVADRTGGRALLVPNTSGPELPAALATLLG